MIQNDEIWGEEGLLTYWQKCLLSLYFINETSFKAHLEFALQVGLESLLQIAIPLALPCNHNATKNTDSKCGRGKICFCALKMHDTEHNKCELTSKPEG